MSDEPQPRAWYDIDTRTNLELTAAAAAALAAVAAANKTVSSWTPPPRAPMPPKPRPAPSPRNWQPVEPLAAKYKPAARRITLAMVAAPIAIVTGWVLYDRLVLGTERKDVAELNASWARAKADAAAVAEERREAER